MSIGFFETLRSLIPKLVTDRTVCGTLEQANRGNIIDMDEIDYRRDGYWTDHKSTWGVALAYSL